MWQEDRWRARESVLAAGMISGTSVDGIDVAVVRVYQDHKQMPDLLWFETVPYSPALREWILEISVPGKGTVDRITRAHWAVGHAFAQAARAAIAGAQLSADEVDFIASHGQTIHHLPAAAAIDSQPSRGTLQIGEPAVIAAETGLLTISDFRSADMACGGQGAPLVPFFDWVYFTHPTEHRVLVNIGGIANVTFLPAAAPREMVVAFDSGPGNMISDAICVQEFHQPFDSDGSRAASGTANAELLAALMRHPYLQLPWPKSTGREEFGARFVARLRNRAHTLGLTPQDLLATVMRFVAESIARAIREVAAGKPVAKIIVGGGGRRNLALMRILAEVCAPAAVLPIDDFGVNGDAKEAVCFACLGYETVCGRPGNMPAATGASRLVRLGKLTFPN